MDVFKMIHRLKTYQNGVHGDFFLEVAELLTSLITEKEPSAQSPAAMAGSAALLREMKDELRAHISEHELDDGDELDTETEDLILGWIENFFENKIYDMEQEQ
jgi:hypothetical protein